MIKISFYINENAPEKISKRGVSYGYFFFEYFVWRKLLDYYREINSSGADELLELTFSCPEDWEDDEPNGDCVPYSIEELKEKLKLLFELRDAIKKDESIHFSNEVPWIDEDGDDFDVESDMVQRDLIWVMDSIVVIFEHAIEIEMPFTVFVDFQN